jgi:hypothetical protein
LSEPTTESPLVRVGETDGFINPILYIEELRRIPLNRSRIPPVGTALVFRTRSGRLCFPDGGYTAGEMFLLGPRTGYRVDVSAHGFRASFEVGADLAVDVHGQWTVVDPVEVVANRISDAEYACTTALRDRIAVALPSPVRDLDEVQDRLTTAFDGEVAVTGGIRLDRLRVVVTVARLLTSEHMLQMLVADEDIDRGDPVRGDYSRLLQELTELAQQGLDEHGTEGTVRLALVRFHELVTRMGDMLPPGEARAGDDERR